VTFQATLKVGTGLQKTTIEANNYNHALAMLYSLYGKQNIMNVFQLSR
jgi:hypothetical protein